MNIFEFVKEYNEKDGLERIYYIKERIKNNYIGIEKKIAICNTVISNTCYTKINEMEFYKPDSIMKDIFFKMELIAIYTDIEVSFNEDFAKQYDELEKYNLIDSILEQIDSIEIQRMKDLLKMKETDTSDNERSLVSYLDSKIKSLEVLINSIPELIQNFDMGKLEEMLKELPNG